MLVARKVADTLSISRAFLSFIFLVTVLSGIEYFWYAVGVFFIAELTDFLDGFIARKYTVPTLQGYMLDSLGDKVFYTAAIISFNTLNILNPLVSWALITREITLYIVRICNPEKTQKVKSIHVYSRVHAVFIRLSFILCLTSLYNGYLGIGSGEIEVIANVSAGFACISGAIGLYFFFKLE